MSDNEEFLSRWSRRKREARQVGESVPQPVEPVEAPNSAPSDAPVAEPADFEVGLSSLPPIDSIDATADITAFLREGIPQQLNRAALRRAWSTDPAIRDFVGPAENAWDFNDPQAMPGFSLLDSSQAELSGIVDRIVGGMQQVATSLPDMPAAVEDVELLADQESSPNEQEPVPMQTMRAPQMPNASRTAEVLAASVASHSTSGEKVAREKISVRHRTHGGALPR